jgi:uncharacterized protein (DUF58 family)
MRPKPEVPNRSPQANGLTGRGRIALALGGGLYLVAWAFGSDPIYPVAVGLVLAVLVAWIWVRALAQPMRLSRSTAVAEPVEGRDVTLELELTAEGRVKPSSLVVLDRIEGLGAFEIVLHRQGRSLRGRQAIFRVPRGRYRFAEARALLEDPFGLARTEVSLGATGALLVYPRLVELDRLFSESGAAANEGRRLLLRRPVGFDFHSVREYQEGESLRKVHWPTTARRGQLMVKELEDSPRDEVAVLLDAAAGAVAGEPPESSFDVQVRAAGSILRTHARRGRRALLVVNSLERETQGLRADDGDWRAALELLAAAEPNGLTPAHVLLSDESSPAARALELAVVTARLDPPLVERLIRRAQTRRAVSLVFVDAATFAATPRRVPQPALLRLQACGVPVVVVRRGDDLRARLTAGLFAEAARA